VDARPIQLRQINRASLAKRKSLGEGGEAEKGRQKLARREPCALCDFWFRRIEHSKEDMSQQAARRGNQG